MSDLLEVFLGILGGFQTLIFMALIAVVHVGLSNSLDHFLSGGVQHKDHVELQRPVTRGQMHRLLQSSAALEEQVAVEGDELVLLGVLGCLEGLPLVREIKLSFRDRGQEPNVVPIKEPIQRRLVNLDGLSELVLEEVDMSKVDPGIWKLMRSSLAQMCEDGLCFGKSTTLPDHSGGSIGGEEVGTALTLDHSRIEGKSAREVLNVLTSRLVCVLTVSVMFRARKEYVAKKHIRKSMIRVPAQNLFQVFLSTGEVQDFHGQLCKMDKSLLVIRIDLQG
mmetsp:Transcript_27134/g.88688  ORF Transcript_27134/g.88688 Transcript_27134/m.88688 type:complete len:278 (+) Transcript_27134:2400-3233(+)